MWRVTDHAVDTKAGHTRLTRPEGCPDELWWRFAEFLADHLNGENTMTKSRQNDKLFTDDRHVDDDGCEYGLTKEDLGRAIQVLECCHESLTIPQAAAIYQVSTMLVSEVVDDHPWLFESGGIICAEGM